MSIQKVQCCQSRHPWHQMFVLSESQPGVFHTVTRPFPHDPLDRWYCSCKSFTFRAYCKHRARVKPCDWDAESGPEVQTEAQRKNHTCPRCGGPTFDDLIEDNE